MMSISKPTVAVAGASGFVGRAVCQILSKDFRVVGLTRRKPHDHRTGDGGVHEWRSCDLFRFDATCEALSGVDFAVYLVHSMMPRDRLTQGSFADLDILLADNFGRAAKYNQLKHIVYLGGLLPKEGRLSDHLRSRREVEVLLSKSGVPLTTLRAGLIIGGSGSSSHLLLRLVQRLPVMLCPRWVNTKSQPVVVGDIVQILARVVGNPTFFNQTYDVGGPEIVSYRWLMQETARVLGRRLPVLVIPFLNPKLSLLWLRLVTGAPTSLIKPLINSLEHEMVAQDSRIWDQTGLTPSPLLAGIEELASSGPTTPRAFRSLTVGNRIPTVRSVQRLPRPAATDAATVARLYLDWLPRFFRFFLTAKTDSKTCSFYAFRLKEPLLVLEMQDERFGDAGPLFKISGGLLVKPSRGARLEFRTTLEGSYIIASIHDFTPRLWWPLYRWGQAPVHAWVMRAFRKYLVQHKRSAGEVLACIP